jgi:integrase
MGWVTKRCRCRSAAEKTTCTCPDSATRWRAAYRADGRVIYDTFRLKTDATNWITKQTAALHRGDHVDPALGRIPFGRWADLWAPPRQAVLKGSTWTAESGRLKNHIRPFFDDIPIGQITPGLVRTWVAQISRSPKTVRHCHALLHLIMADAVAEGLVTKNPCVGTRLPTIERREMVFLTEQQLQQLFGAVGEWWKPLTMLLAGTGLRWGEAVGLKVGRVDLLTGYLTVSETLNETGGRCVWSTPKTRSSRRRVKLPLEVVDVLVPLVAGKKASEPVFLTKQGNLVRNRVFRDRVWTPAVKSLEWSPAPRIHDLRHTHVALLIAAGTPLTAIQRRLGHASIAVTSDGYGHLLPTVEDAMVAALDLALGRRPDPSHLVSG